MTTETVTKNGQVVPQHISVAPEDKALRELAIKQVERVKSFKLNLVAFIVGTIVLGGVWVATEYL